MKAVSQLVVHVADLMEAEGKALLLAIRAEAHSLHGVATNLALAATFLILAVPFILGGTLLLAIALMLWLETLFAQPVAAAITGLVVLTIGLACIAAFKLLAGKHV